MKAGFYTQEYAVSQAKWWSRWDKKPYCVVESKQYPKATDRFMVVGQTLLDRYATSSTPCPWVVVDRFVNGQKEVTEE